MSELTTKDFTPDYLVTIREARYAELLGAEKELQLLRKALEPVDGYNLNIIKKMFDIATETEAD